MIQRKHKRINIKLYARLSSELLNCRGLIHNISEGGLFICSSKEFRQGSIIDIEIFMPDNEISFLKGVVRRNTEKPDAERRYGLGIELIKIDSRYRFFVKNLCANHNNITVEKIFTGKNYQAHI